MISPVSAISGYRVNAIYGNPTSMKPVSAIQEETVANKALMTVSMNKQESRQADKKEMMKEEASEQKLPPTTSVASGDLADFVMQISRMNQENSPVSSEKLQNQSRECTSVFQGTSFEADFLKMGAAQNVRDMVNEPMNKENPTQEAIKIAS